MSCVTTAFMAGLAVGSFAAGHWLKGAPAAASRPLRFYGIIEGLAGLTGSLICWSLFHHSNVYIRLLGPGAGVAADFSLTLALLIVPTSLMGATFPILAAEFPDRRWLPKLYGFNTLGAAFGSLVSGFVLVYYLGCLGSALVAGALNLAICLWACLLDRRRAPTAPPMPQVPAARLPRPPGAPRLAALLAVVSGFVVLSSEIAWFRYLSLFLGNRIYVSSVVLFIILYCLGFAARLSHKLLLKRSPLSVLSSACVLGIVSLAIGSAAQRPAMRIVLESGSSGDLLNRAAAFVFILGSIVIPAVAMGCLFPLALALGAREDQAPPGWLYGLNTLSAVLGSLFSSYFLMGLVGANGIMALSALLLLLLLAGASILSRETSSPARRWQAAAAGLSFLLGIAPGARAKLNLFSPDKTLLVREDAHGLFTIARADDGRLIVMNNNTALAFLFGDERTQFVQETQAYLPMLFSRNVDALLNIGIGYGITAGAMTLFPEVKDIEAVEILPAMVQSRELFASRNYRYYDDPRVKIRIADGRQFLAASAKKFDVISVNVTDPYLPGSSSLFSDEFYGLAKDSLAPGGVLCQHIFGPDVVSLYHGIMRHFHYLKLIKAYENGFTVIASDEPLRPRRLDSLKKVVAAHRESGSAHFALRSAGQLLTLVEDGDRWRERLESMKPALLDSDDRPELEFRRLSGLKSILHSNN